MDKISPKRSGKNESRPNQRKQRKKPRQRQAKRANKKPETKAQKLLESTGGHGTEIRSISSRGKAADKAALVLPSQDPTLDVAVLYTSRALMYLAMGTVLRAIKRGYLSLLTDTDDSCYYAFRYLFEAYCQAVNGTIPALQQAPLYVWEICYALRPKTEAFKTGTINFQGVIRDLVDTGIPNIDFPLGPGPDEDYHIFWGNPGITQVNGFLTLQPPSTPYSQALGESAIKSLWQCFDKDGLCILVGDPGTGCVLAHDTSSFAMNYSEIGTSYGAPGGMSTTLYSERFISSPMLSKFCEYQADNSPWRGFHSFHKSAGSATYIGPRGSELTDAHGFRNKVSPIFTYYNFDEYVEQAALIIARAMEQLASNNTSELYPYPLSCQELSILLRQSIINYFSNEMAQDLRISLGDGLMVAMLPLTVGPNGASFTATGAGMRMPRFFVESVRCARRLTSKLKYKGQSSTNMVLDLVPILCRPCNVPELAQYKWFNPRDDSVNNVFPVKVEVPIDIIECACVIDSNKTYVVLNGKTLSDYATLHNDWIAKHSSVLTALSDLSTIEEGIPSLNVNIMTNHLQFQFPAVAEVQRSPGPVSGPRESKTRYGKSRTCTPMFRDPKFEKPTKKHVVNIGSLPSKNLRLGAAPDVDSDYFQKNVAVVRVSSNLPILSTIFNYQSKIIKPIFWFIADLYGGSTLLFQTNQIQPFTVPLSQYKTVFALDSTQTEYGNLFDVHLSAANLDVKAIFTDSLSEMEITFNKLQEEGGGGFFTSLGRAIGGLVDGIAGG